MKRSGQVLEWVLSIGIPLLIVAGLYVKLHQKQEAAFSGRSPQIGEAVHLAGIDWADNRLTLIAVMQVGCHWCEESAPFYRALTAQESAGHKFHVVAVLPQSRNQSQEFLHTLGIGIQDIRQKELYELDVSGTPTLLLVDYRGRIKAFWVGKLEPASEKDVFNNLGVGDDLRANGI